MTPDFVPDSEQEKNKQVDEQEKNKQVVFLRPGTNGKKKGPNAQCHAKMQPPERVRIVHILTWAVACLPIQLRAFVVREIPATLFNPT
jgi:hypothetical protein